ncbi:hypothetical protein [Paraburkholderia phytofirmans]|uniref:Uncharacterized protein n=2 Tax=Paraburkholderia phytofirmans TaxID=261302 RepID=B2SXC2_PARPJ|nr:hypothetical protein [Paraburkholderia phytofirmans]ACD15164.1 hypothetical protein Bphyt_0740 [Paraburkholderia phytofirmans PsJN]
MSPFCLIDLAGIRDHATVPHDVRESGLHSRLRACLSGWMIRLLHAFHG